MTTPTTPIRDASTPKRVTHADHRCDASTATFAQVVTHVTRNPDITARDAMTRVTRYLGSSPIRGRACVRAIGVNQTTRHTRHHPTPGSQR